MKRERISELQKRLFSLKKGRPQEYIDDYLISIEEPFRRLEERFLKLFNIDILDENPGSGKFIGTPAQFRSVVDDLLILAEISGVDLERAIWQKYPNKCPYCSQKPCLCGGRKTAPHKKLRVRFPKNGLDIGGAQRMLAEIYPLANRLEAVLHTIEEISEAETEVVTSGSHRDIQDEFADTFARMAGLATVQGICLEGFKPDEDAKN